MSLPPALPFGSPVTSVAMNEQDRARARALVVLFSIAALAAGAFAAVASHDVVAFVGGLLLILLAAWVLPLPWTGILLAALVPFQFYFQVPGSSFTLRAALVPVFALAARAALDIILSAVGGQRSSVWSRFAWLLPAGFFLLAALFAAFAAQDRYAAFKGIYDWLAVFLTAIVIAAQRPSRAIVRRILVILIAGGVLQALLGLAQYMLGLDAVLNLLRQPASGLLYQPNLLSDRLNDLSFNWVNFDRALPFGTFINGIDYAVFLAAVLSLIIALIVPARRSAVSGRGASVALGLEKGRWLTSPPAPLLRGEGSPLLPSPFRRGAGGEVARHFKRLFSSRMVALAGSAILIGVTVLLTFKGSGALALGGGIAAIALFSLPRLSRQIVFVGLLLVIGAFVLALPFSDLLGQRALFLLEREQGLLSATGRLAIWSSLLQFIAQRPFFGYGLNNAIALIEPQRTLRAGASALLVSTPESAYVSSLVETGLVGFVALGAWLLGAVTAGWRRAIGMDAGLFMGIVAALAALLAGNLTVSGLTTDQNGMLLGMLVGLVYGMQRDE